MIYNARSYLDDDYWEFVSLARPFPDLPGTWDKDGSLFALKTLCAMTAAFLVASDLMAEAAWRLRLWLGMAIAGCSVIFYGLLVKGLGQDCGLAMYHDVDAITTFFGPYRYHANAGAYINLVWPVLLALFVRSWRDREAYIGRAIWSFCLVVALAAAFINTSKASAVITGVMMAVAVFAFGSFFWSNLMRTRKASRIVAAAFLVGIVATLIYGGVTNSLQQRWQIAFESKDMGDVNGRLVVEKICLQMIPEAGWMGFGPGTFSKVFPFHTGEEGYSIPGFWVYAHEDYLQTVVEYGYIGAFFWSVLLFGSILRAAVQGLRSCLRTNERVFYRACALALGGIALHSLVDFPLQIGSLQLYVMMFFARAWSEGASLKSEALQEGT
jgi:hypothetical protein